MKKPEYSMKELLEGWQAFDFKKARKKFEFQKEVKKILKEEE